MILEERLKSIFKRVIGYEYYTMGLQNNQNRVELYNNVTVNVIN